jgi:diguanylate cyclase (GGDEF)-like protein
VVILFPNTVESMAQNIAERIRYLVEESSIVVNHDSFGERNLQCTISIGIATLTDNTVFDDKYLLHLADIALYQAKKKGRNRMITYQSEYGLQN